MKLDSAFSGQNSWIRMLPTIPHGTVGMGTTMQNGSNPAVLNPTGSATETDYNVGQGMNTGTAEALGSAGGTQPSNQMAFSIEKVTVTAKSQSPQS